MHASFWAICLAGLVGGVACASQPVASRSSPPTSEILAGREDRYIVSAEPPQWALRESAWIHRERWYAVGIAAGLSNPSLAQSMARIHAMAEISRRRNAQAFAVDSNTRVIRTERHDLPNGAQEISVHDLETDLTRRGVLSASSLCDANVIQIWFNGRDTWAALVEAPLDQRGCEAFGDLHAG